MATTMRLFTFASPARFYALAGTLIPWFWIAALALAAAGLWIGFFQAPTDATQGDAYRIIFIHVPAAWMSMVIYLAMAFWAAVGWAFNIRMGAMLAHALAPTGALFTFIALWTGAFWGKPAWGTWWVWDARLTSELILLFLYIGYIALTEAIDDVRRSLQFLAENGAEAGGSAARAAGSIFTRTQDTETRRLCLSALYKINDKTARNELLRIYREEQTNSDLRTAIADHLRERTIDEKRVSPTEAKPVLSVSGQP